VSEADIAKLCVPKQWGSVTETAACAR